MPSSRVPPSRLLTNFLKPADFRYLTDVVAKRARSMTNHLVELNEVFGRRFVHNDPLLKDLHRSLEPRASRYVGMPVKKSFSFISLYGRNGVAPRHRDRDASRYAINVCVAQDERWPLYVGDTEYLLDENDAVFFCGTKVEHFREKIRSRYCRMVTFFFVPTSFRGPLCRPGRE